MKENNEIDERKLLILGAGQYGHVLKEVAEATGQYSQIAFLDDTPVEGVIGKLSEYERFADCYTDAIVAIGNPEVRMRWLEELGENFIIPVIIHPTAYVSPSANVGVGSIVEPLAVIHTEVIIGRGCIISAGSIINHNCVVAEGVHCDVGCVIPARSQIEPMKKIVQGELPLR